MKTKLLRKVRRNFRIVENGFGKRTLQERDIFGWTKYGENSFEIWHINQIYHYKTNLELLRCILDYRYSKYTRKEKVKSIKSKNIKVIWYVNS